MKHVIEVEDEEAAVLTETGSGGLIGRGLLHDRPLADYLDDRETPRYVLRNKKRGFSVERAADADPEPSGATALDPGESTDIAPDGDHSAAALVTDVRVLFAVGRTDGDRTRSVPLADVVDARTADGFLGGSFVLDTVAGEQYRFPSRGALDAVREFVDVAAGVWARAERQLERTDGALERVEEALASGDADAALAAVGDARERLDEARETASSLAGAAASLEGRVADYRDRLDLYERRAHAERAAQARERAHDRWDEEAYEAAADLLERSDEDYAAALAIDAARPADDLIERRRDAIAADRERLATSPLERAERAVRAASSADGPEAAADWWAEALDRYETLRSLDWGREERRFEGDREAIRERLATAAERLVEARCDLARRDLEAANGAPRQTVAEAYERADESLAAAREIARERAPDALGTVERLQDELDDRRAALSAGDDSDSAAGGPADQTAVVDSVRDDGSSGVPGPGPSDGDPEEQPEEFGEPDPEPPGAAESPVEPADDSTASTGELDASVESPVPDAAEPGGPDGASGDGDWVFVEGSDDEWLSAERAGVPDASADSGPEEAVGSGPSVPTDSGPNVSGDSGSEGEVEPAADGADGSAADGTSDSTAGPPSSLADVPRDAFPALVADLFRAAGWTVTAPDDGEVDVLAEATGPVSVTLAVRTVPAGESAAHGAAAVERHATAVEASDDRDVAVVAAGAHLPDDARDRAAERGVRVLGPEALAAELDGSGVALDAYQSSP